METQNKSAYDKFSHSSSHMKMYNLLVSMHDILAEDNRLSDEDENKYVHIVSNYKESLLEELDDAILNEKDLCDVQSNARTL